MFRQSSPEVNDSGLFFVEQTSNGPSPPRPNTPIVLNSMEFPGNNTPEMITISSIASPDPQTVSIDTDPNEPTMPYGFERQLPIIPPSLNGLNRPPNPFILLATMAAANPIAKGQDKNYSPHQRSCRKRQQFRRPR